MSDQDDEQNELLEALLESERLQRKLQEDLQRGVGLTQSSLDNTRATIELARHGVIRGANALRLSATYHALNDEARALTHVMQEPIYAYGTAAAQTAGVVSTAAIELSLEQQNDPPQELTSALQRHFDLTMRADALEELRADLVRCGLNKQRGGNRSPLDLLNECAAALYQPSRIEVSPTSALIPLRGAIGRTVLDLLARCPDQEQTKSWRERILSLGRRCGRIGIANGHFTILADVVAGKIDAISDGKEAALAREQVIWLYQDGLKFLIALLRGIDEHRLRA